MNNRHFFVAVIIAVFVVAEIMLLATKPLWWDAAVYAGMGKYLWSGGTSGLWEPSRPPVWPLLLGAFWKFNIPLETAGKLLDIFFAGGCIFLTYLLGKKIAGERTGIIAAALLAATPTFFKFSGMMLSEIPSTFFMLLGLYFFTHGKYFYAGILGAIAFLTRFLHLFAFAGILGSLGIFWLLSIKKKPNNSTIPKNALVLLCGFLIAVWLYLLSNYLLYRNFFLPFTDQIFMTQYTGWMYDGPWWFYWANIPKELPLFIFGFVGIITVLLNRGKNYNSDNYFSKIAVVCAVPFLFFNLITHKEMRLLIIILPYFSVLTACGLMYFLRVFQNKYATYARAFLAIIILAGLGMQIFVIVQQTKLTYHSELSLLKFQRYLLQGQITGTVWISNPRYAMDFDGVVQKIYYPTFDEKYGQKLIEQLPSAAYILLNTCDIPCRPDRYLKNCEEKKEQLISSITAHFWLEYYDTKNGCKALIARR